MSHRESLRRLFKGRAVDEAALQSMMDRKSAIFQDLLEGLSPRDLLLGVAELFDLLDGTSLRFGITSTSRNARATVDKLGIAGRLSVLVDGHSVTRQKPAPDLFRCAVGAAGRAARQCLVIEDAAAGIEAALIASATARPQLTTPLPTAFIPAEVVGTPTGRSLDEQVPGLTTAPKTCRSGTAWPQTW